MRQDGESVQFLRIAKSPTLNNAFQMWTLTGVTMDSTSIPIGSCQVDAFRSDSDTFVGGAVSDPGAGAHRGVFSIPVGSNSSTFYLVAYLPGTPDIAGTTVNTLTAT